MITLDQSYTTILIASVIISASIAIAAMMHRRTTGVYIFVVLMTTIGLWALVSVIEVYSKSIETKVFMHHLKYLFIVIVPIAWFLFGRYYASRITKLKWQRITSLMIFPAITFFLVTTNHYHHMMFTSLGVITKGSFLYIVPNFGPWFWLHVAYSYILIFSGFLFMAKHFIDSPTHHRWQVVTLFVGGLTPWAANMFFILKLMPYPYLDLMAFAFTISGFAFMVGVLRFQILDVVPIAQQVVFENINEGIIVVDSAQRILNLNPAAIRLSDRSGPHVIGSKAHRVFSWWDKLKINSTESEPPDLSVIELVVGKKNRLLRPKKMPLKCNEKETGLLVTLYDVTEEHQLQSQLFQSQKMEAIGTLAGGIAHDFNNLLMGMQANLSLMHLSPKKDPDQHDRIKRIETQIQSGANLTRQLLGYARKGKYVVSNVNLDHLIKETLTVVQRTNKAITIQSLLSDDPIMMKADRGQIEMALLNLFVNAMDAMPQGGRLTVSTRHIEDMMSSNIGEENTRFCELLVADTGIGMDPATRKRIFEPFFTTKDVGHGTGLGLASVYGVVQNHGGHIDVESIEGEGTTFTLHLPTTQETVQEEIPPEAPTIGTVSGGTILLVEDEPLILKYSLEMIHSLGFKTLSTQNGKEAVNIYERHHAEINLVVLDMVMPGMDGLAVYNALTRINPLVRIVITSGYATDRRIDEILSRGCHTSLRKPYTREELAEQVARALAPLVET